MKTLATIPSSTQKKKPFFRNGKKESFVKAGELKEHSSRVNKEEGKAESFAQTIAANPVVFQAYRQTNLSPKTPKKSTPILTEGESLEGIALPAPLQKVLEAELGESFADVRIHADGFSTKLTEQYNAAAVTSGKHIFLNTNVYDPATIDGLLLLAHELFHTLQPESEQKNLEVQLKPLTELTDQTPYQKTALQRAVNIALGEQGKVNSNALNEDKTRVGWQFLVEYFKTTFGEENIVSNAADYKPGKLMEDVIKYVKKGKAQKVRIINKKHELVNESNVDLLPSWCGIFIFWAFHKAGIHPPLWEVGKPNISAADQYKKGEYLPRPGDIVIKNGYNHFAIVVRTEPATIKDTTELSSVKVVTINGNTAGSNHQGGQIQEKTDSYSYWDYYVNPFFKGVQVTDEASYKIDERLKKSLEKGPGAVRPPIVLANANTTVNQYDTSLQPVGLNIPATASAEGEKEPMEEAKVNPKEIMASDKEFGELHGKLDQNAKKQKDHGDPGVKAGEAQHSAVSPPNERISGAKAKKVTRLGEMMANEKPSKKFSSEELKAAILKEVDRLIKEKEEQANETGEKPKINQKEIEDVKETNNKDIKAQKKESIGTFEEAHKEPPDEKTVEERKSDDVIVEDPGPGKHIPDTEKAVAKPIAEERLNLDADSEKIDQKMAENDVDEQQLEESGEPQFENAVAEKKDSQAAASKVSEDYRKEEKGQLDGDKKAARSTINNRVEKIHEARGTEFGNVNTAKDATKTADEAKRKEVADKIEKLYTDAETSVNAKLTDLETSVNTEFDQIMETANNNFKDNVNNALDDEFTWEWAAKHLDREDYNQRVRKVFVNESTKYRQELSDALNPLTTKIAITLNSIIDEIQAAKNAVVTFVEGLPNDLADIGVKSAGVVLEKFKSLEQSVNEKQEALTNGLAKKYADGVIGLEAKFKEIMDSRKSWLEKALDAIIDAIKEIINLLSDLKKALERAAEYGRRIIKAPGKFFNNLADGASAGFNNFVKNIGKHLLQGALEWVTGEMSDAGIQLPDKFDFRGILSIILQILGISVANVKEIARKVVGAKYVDMLEKGMELGVKTSEKVLQIFTIVKKDGIAGLWEFIKEQFNDLKERLMEEAKSFIITTIIEAAVIKVVSMLIPGAGFITAIKALIDFVRTLFAKARQIVNIITGIIDTFGEVLAGNVAKVSSMVENVLAKFLSMAITFLAAILGLGKVGKKINEIIQKKIRDPINAAITKMMQKLKDVMTKLGIFKLLDKVDEKIKAGKQWVEAKKEAVKEKAVQTWDKFKKWLSLKKSFTAEDGETHSLYFSKSKNPDLMIASKPVTFAAFIKSIETNGDGTLEKAKATSLKIAQQIDEKKAISLQTKSPSEEEVQKFEEKKAKDLLDLFGNLAVAAAKLFKTLKAPEVEAHFGSQDANSQFATAAHILYLNKKYAKNGSAPTSTNTPVYEQLNLRRSGGGSYYIKGHLLNQKMGGRGDWENLTPLSRSGNAQHETTVESVGKQFLDSSAVISYDVLPVYNLGERKAEGKQTIAALKKAGDTDFDTKEKIIEAENYTPVALDVSATLMMKKGDEFVKGAAIFSNKKVANTIDRSPNSYDISGEKKVMVYLDAENVPTLRKNLKAGNFDDVLVEKIVAAYKKDDNIRQYDVLFSLGNIVSKKEQDFVRDRLILFHKSV